MCNLVIILDAQVQEPKMTVVTESKPWHLVSRTTNLFQMHI